MAITAEYAVANPQGGRVVAGDVTIAGSGNRLDVRQASDKGIVDWRSFNIDRAEHTDFQQPSSSAVTLNRVRGGELSQIDGQLTANGRVFLVNPSGVVFGSESKVSVGGLVASTADVRDEDFMTGRYAFDKPSDNPDAKVVNRGQITVDEGGAVVLAAPTVSNEGTIQARLGRVELAGTNTFAVDFDGDGLLSFEVGEEVTETPTNSDDAAPVSNSGTINADGGVVSMTAAVADAVVDRVMNMNGVIQARTAEVREGAIVLSGGEHGIVDVSGTLDASGAKPGQRGGQVKVLGEKVGLFDGAELDVSGDAGGGEVLIGGNFQGKGPEPGAACTYVDDNAEIHADARVDGDAGRVIVWADEGTQFYGDISARGGEQGGDGGFVEVSGKQNLDFRGTVAVDAEYGMDGTVLLDPETIVVDDTGVNPNDSFIAFDDFGAVTLGISDEALEDLTGNIHLQASDDITIDAELNLTKQASGESVVMQAGNDINVNASIITSGADVVLEADSPDAPEPEPSNDPSLENDPPPENDDDDLDLDFDGTPGQLTLSSGATIQTSGGDVTLIAHTFSIANDVVMSTEAGDINIAQSSNEQDFNVFGLGNEGLGGMDTDGVLTVGARTC